MCIDGRVVGPGYDSVGIRGWLGSGRFDITHLIVDAGGALVGAILILWRAFVRSRAHGGILRRRLYATPGPL